MGQTIPSYLISIEIEKQNRGYSGNEKDKKNFIRIRIIQWIVNESDRFFYSEVIYSTTLSLFLYQCLKFIKNLSPLYEHVHFPDLNSRNPLSFR
jgi:hypothetical protein